MTIIYVAEYKRHFVKLLGYLNDSSGNEIKKDNDNRAYRNRKMDQATPFTKMITGKYQEHRSPYRGSVTT